MLDVINVSTSTSINRKQILHNISLKISPGEIVGLIGPNGAGKTTLMKTILGLKKFDGKILLDGYQITENNHRALTQVGALIENPAIYPFLTGYQNLSLYCQDNDDIHQITSTLKMNPFINEKAKSYSIGMKQKLGIALSLLNHPELIILDEPMNGLDMESTILVRQIIKKYASEGCSFLISSHILSELQKVMTNVILINNGQIVVDKKMAEFYPTRSINYCIKTDDIVDTKHLLSSNNIAFQELSNSLIVDASETPAIQDILFTHKIHFTELSPLKTNFENKIMNLLKDREVSAK